MTRLITIELDEYNKLLEIKKNHEENAEILEGKVIMSKENYEELLVCKEKNEEIIKILNDCIYRYGIHDMTTNDFDKLLKILKTEERKQYDYENYLCEGNDQLKKKINQLETNIDEALKKLDSFISCCKCEKLESGSDRLHHQYWNMFEGFNKQIKEILERGKE